MRVYSQNPLSIAQRERRAKARAERIAAGWVDRRWGRRSVSKTKSELVRAWRQRHPERAHLLNQFYGRMRRSAIYRHAWPEIVKHYGPCVRCAPNTPKTRPSTDHVVPLLGLRDCRAVEKRNCLANLQPLCLSCNTKKREQSTDYRPDKGAWIVENYGFMAKIIFHLTPQTDQNHALYLHAQKPGSRYTGTKWRTETNRVANRRAQESGSTGDTSTDGTPGSLEAVG